MNYLGQRFEIHGGGADLIFPHHSSEIAQSEVYSHQHPFVKYWMHIGMVHIDGEKMSKSLGNLVLVRNLLQTYTPDAVRVMLLSHHYRQPWEYTEADMRSNAEIARELVVSVNTVRTHIQNIYRKLAAHNRPAAIETARQLHLLA